MTQSLRHRGPDAQGQLVRPHPEGVVALSHTRLAIVDLSEAGVQPMRSASVPCWITFNGEVYNFEALRSQLPDASFRSKTDTEVILELFATRGIDSLGQLRGMFGFGIWDERDHTLTLVRDPFGIKPVYYVQTGGTFLFASEIRALLATGLVGKRLSPQGVQSYLRNGSVASPETIIDGVRLLPPGSYLRVRLRNRVEADEPQPYGSFFVADQEARPRSREDALDRLRGILKDSIRLHHISDVPLGVFLSGGIDSSALVALSKAISQQPPKTFSVVFAEKQFSERDHARVVAEQFGTDHREIMLSESGLLSQLPEALASLDQPSMDGFNTYVISKAVKEAGITVALSGLGGDELFAGYSSFRRALWMQSVGLAPGFLRRGAASLGKRFLNGSVHRTKFWELIGSDATPDAAYSITRRLFSPAEIGALVKHRMMDDAPVDAAIARDAINRVSQLELQGYMANTLLRDTDSMSMAHALEVRVPFVDVNVAGFVLNLPGEWKVAGSRPKPLLIDALDGMLPDSVWNRPKMGFSLPFERWMHSALQPEIEETFRRPHLGQLGFDSQQSIALWRRFQQHPACEKWSRPWSLYVLDKWCERNEVRA